MITSQHEITDEDLSSLDLHPDEINDSKSFHYHSTGKKWYEVKIKWEERNFPASI